MDINRETLEARLARYGQGHLLQFWDELDEAGRGRLAEQIAELDLDQLSQLIAGEDPKPDFAALAASAEPPPAVRADGSGAAWSVAEATARGEAALAAGKVAAVLVAGGQGTRLGFDQPKGMFPIGPVSGRTLFEIFAARLRGIERRYGRPLPLYLMTSAATDAETREYFESHDFLALDRDHVRIFQQGTMPAVDAETGELLLAEKDSLALSPDGHGGTVRGLDRSGSLDDMERRGIEQIFYFQVDNPLVALCDPTLIGHHLRAGSEMTTQVVRKRFPTERVGNVVMVDGRVQIIEYSDLPDEAARATQPDGSLRLWAGNIAVHVIDRAFLRRIARSDQGLPFHRASKRVPYIAPSGQRVEPEGLNATKFERFIFDLLPAAENAFVAETLAEESFAPVKNADGAATDTAETARAAMVALHRRWLQEAGVEVKEGIQVEIDPEFALSPEELSKKLSTKSRIESNRFLTFD